MTFRHTAWLVLWVMLLLAASPAQAADVHDKVSLTQYRERLAQAQQQVSDLATHPDRAESIRASLPESWDVSASDGSSFEVNTEFLTTALTDFQKSTPEKKKTLLQHLQTRLEGMQAASVEYESARTVDQPMRDRLDQILAAREFNAVQGPTAWEIFWEKVGLWITKWLSKINPHLPDAEGLGTIFVWIVITAVICVLAIYLYRVYRRQPPTIQREILPFVPSSKSWRVWLAEARAESAAGRWRDAIHLSYWAGVSYLEALGSWKPDRARTPREYIRAIGQSPHKPVFVSLTRRFENVWYGGRDAGNSDFEAAVSELEELGCR